MSFLSLTSAWILNHVSISDSAMNGFGVVVGCDVVGGWSWDFCGDVGMCVDGWALVQFEGRIIMSLGFEGLFSRLELAKSLELTLIDG